MDIYLYPKLVCLNLQKENCILSQKDKGVKHVPRFVDSICTKQWSGNTAYSLFIRQFTIMTSLVAILILILAHRICLLTFNFICHNSRLVHALLTLLCVHC